MSTTRSPNHDLDEYVTILTEFYLFLTRFYIPASSLKFPPPGGWPNITPEVAKNINKSPYVIELMRRLPYIDEKDSRQMITNIHYKCDVVDYSVKTTEQFANGYYTSGEEGMQYTFEQHEQVRKELEEDDEDMEDHDHDDDEQEDNEGQVDEVADAVDVDTNPDEAYHSQAEADMDVQDNDEDNEGTEDEYEDDDDEDDDDDGYFRMTDLLVIAEGYESGGRSLILDVHKGQIWEDIVRCDLASPVGIGSFFTSLQQKFESLEIVPIRGELFENVPEFEEDETNSEFVKDDGVYEWGDERNARTYKRIYRSFGWPGEAYRKEEAMGAVEAFRMERKAWFDRVRDEQR
ncbi:hypothetical protein NX059_009617 [Plenodomus lindquistii]|nr:hypothetical protein NX059_009617 [Plenodomus lindquistii]